MGKRVDPAESTVLASGKPPESASADDGELTPLALRRPADDDQLDIAVAKAKAEAALFGEAEAVKIGRYHLIERAGAGGMGVVWKAFDPDLNRGIALKLASAGDLEARRRARDEGRSLAKLSHPNVVPIYDVIEHESGVFLVMELVKGQTLRQLAAEATPLQLVRAYRQAGGGLAAAHEAGLVHRDFKPDNAIMGADERVRVLDFGLAHEVSSELREIAGTPRYMAPEQRSGESLTPAADQYAFCVALRESLSSKGQVPRWLQPILARGAAEKPSDRYPSMSALLAALALDPATRWRRRGVAALAIAAVGVGIGAFSIGRSQQEESPCEGGAGILAPSWGADRRAAITRYLGGLATPYAAEAAPRITSSLDTYTTDWVRIYKASCQAHRRGEISPALLDRRSGCLSRRRAALATFAELATAVTGEALPDLVIAVGELPDVSACDDDDALMAGGEPPPPAAAAQAASIADDIAKVDVERDAGRLKDAKRHADDTVARAEALGYRPLRARALLARGRIQLTGMSGDRGAEDFRAATRESLAVGDDPMSIESYARLAYAVGTTGDPSRATHGLELIQAIADGTGERALFARSLLHHNVGSVLLSRGDRTAARAAFEEARKVGAGVAGSGAIELTVNLSGLLLVTDDDAHREVVGDELVATRTRLLGARHPLTLQSQILAAEMRADPAAVRARLQAPCTDLATFHPATGHYIGECGYELALLATVAGDSTAAAAAADRVVAGADRGIEPEYVTFARAYQRLASKEPKAAIEHLESIDPVLDGTSPWWKKLTAAEVALGRTLALTALGDPAGAQDALTRASTLYDQISAAMPPPILARRRHLLDTLARNLKGSR